MSAFGMSELLSKAIFDEEWRFKVHGHDLGRPRSYCEEIVLAHVRSLLVGDMGLGFFFTF